MSPRPRNARTKPINLRIDVELLTRLEAMALRQRRTMANMLQKILADGLDRLDVEMAIRDKLLESERLFGQMTPEEMQETLRQQERLLAQVSRQAILKRPRPRTRRR
jgi:hypothetical protein